MLKQLALGALGISIAVVSCSSDESNGAPGGAGEANAGAPGNAGEPGETSAGSSSRAGSHGETPGGSTGHAGSPEPGSAGVGGQALGGSGNEPVAGTTSAGAAGAAGHGNQPNCGELIVNAGCADADATTEDFQSGEFGGCVHFKSDGHWVRYDGANGFAYDRDTGLSWALRTPMTMSRAQVSAFCADFELHGHDNWRLPTIDEARVFAGGCPNTAPGGSCLVSDPSCLAQACYMGQQCDSCTAHMGPYGPSKDYCPADSPFCISIATSSSCSDCGVDGDFRNSPINGNFYVGTSANLVFPICVADDVSHADPCPP